MFIQENALVNVVCEMASILSRPQCVKDLQILPIKEINIYIIAQFMFRFHNGLLPEIFDSFFTTNYEIHSHDTRSQTHLHPSIYKSELGRKGIRGRGMFIWNQIIS